MPCEVRTSRHLTKSLQLSRWKTLNIISSGGWAIKDIGSDGGNVTRQKLGVYLGLKQET